jgi:hypothetical protein
VKQAFASWKPGGSESLFTLDFGKFDTPYGAEVAESHLNMNYTRSMLYVSQPVTHTGLRGSFAVSDLFDFKVLAVNGWNNSIDNNVGKTFGAQFNFHFKNSEDADLVGVSVGYLGGPEHDDIAHITCDPGTVFNPSAKSGCAADATATTSTSGVVDRASSNTEGWRHLVDLVVTANPIERLRLVLNADFGVDSARKKDDASVFDSHSYFGVLLGARVAIVDEFGVAARGEYFRDSYRFINPYDDKQDLVGGTLTLDYLPADFLTIRLDGRYDWSSKKIFDSSIRDRVGNQFTTTLGVVAHTD